MEESKIDKLISEESRKGKGVAWNKAMLVYKAIMDYKTEHDGNSPTVRQILEICGISSTSVVNYYLNQLEEARLIRRVTTYGSRNIEVVGGRWLPPGEKEI